VSVIKSLQNLSQVAAAALLEISTRKLRSAGPPRNPDGTYAGPELVAWWVKRKVSQVGPTKNDALELCRLQKLRQLTRQNDMEERKLVSAVEIGRMWDMSSLALRNGLHALQAEFGREIFDRLDFWLREADKSWRREWEYFNGSKNSETHP